MIRAASILSGILILAAATWVTIDAANLSGSHATLVATLAVGVAVGGAVVARSTWRVAVLVAVAVLAGEAYGMIATAERIIAVRDATASSVVHVNTGAAGTTERLRRAESAIVDHDVRAIAAISQRACADQCRVLLGATRAELAADVDRARTATISAPVTRSASPLADRLGLPPWALDLIAAGLLSIGANGLGCILIAWGARASPAVKPRLTSALPMLPPQAEIMAHAEAAGWIAPSKEPSTNVVAIGRRKPEPIPRNTLSAFLTESLHPDDGGRVEMREIIASYRAWCEARGEIPLPTPQVVDALARVVKKTGLETETRGKSVYCVNVKLGAK